MTLWIFIVFEIIATIAIIIAYLKYEERLAQWEQKQLKKFVKGLITLLNSILNTVHRTVYILRIKLAKRLLKGVDVNEIISNSEKKQIVIDFLSERKMIVHRLPETEKKC